MGTACSVLGSVLIALVLALVPSSAAGATSADPGRPAAIRNVHHDPITPKPSVSVLVTARLAEGMTNPVLRLQAVAPGRYVRQSDLAYEKDWTDLPLRDDGKEGDERAGDGVYSARVPASFQRHRWLIRYRVVATGAAGKAVRAPEDDDCPNFAWWCDAGPAAWTGSREPGKAPAVTYPAAFLNTLQALHLLAWAGDVAKSQWDPAAHKQKQEGTLVDTAAGVKSALPLRTHASTSETLNFHCRPTLCAGM
jgi:hypothetical protein